MTVPPGDAHCRGSVRRPRESHGGMVVVGQVMLVSRCGMCSVVAMGGSQLHSSEGVHPRRPPGAGLKAAPVQ